MSLFTRIGYTIDYVIENGLDKTAYGFVYITENLSNGKRYVGQRRFSYGWKNYLGSGSAIRSAVKKYGRDNFRRKIIGIANCLDDLNNLEIFYIDLYNAPRNNRYYNIASGGKNGNTLVGKTEEEMEIFKRNNRKSHLGIFDGEKNPFYGRKHTAESIKKMSESHKGIYDGENNPNYGKHFSEESKEKMRKAKVGIFDGDKNPRARAVICITTGKIFNTAKEAAAFYGFSRSSISVCCTGKRRHGGVDAITGSKLEWMFYDEWINTSYEERKEDI